MACIQMLLAGIAAAKSVQGKPPDMTKFVTRLIKAGAEVHTVDKNDWSPLMHAINGGDMDMVR